MREFYKNKPVSIVYLDADGNVVGNRWGFFQSRFDLKEEVVRLYKISAEEVVKVKAVDYDTKRTIYYYPRTDGGKKPGAGRKGLVKNAKRIVTFRVNDELYHHLKKEGISRYLQRLILEDMKKPRTESGLEG